ncbi:MAG: sirohydrochlorin cobaltochelatase [Desulfatitalea sp.]
MAVPIVMAAFGTTRRALQTYDHMDLLFKRHFAGHAIHWAFTSRMVAARLKHAHGPSRPHPHEVLQTLADAGHRWAVVQSLHLTCGHEFYRLVAEVQHPSIRVSIGLPLLCAEADYHALVESLAPMVGAARDEAIILVGHGTDHPAWSAYTALHFMLQQRYGAKVFVGSVEDGCPDRDAIVAAVIAGGFARVRLVPFMLVAGAHFEEDLAGEEDSWKSAFAAAGVPAILESQGLGYHPQIIALFSRHMAAALDVIPDVDPVAAVASARAVPGTFCF